MINEILNDLWAVGASMILLAIIMKLFFSKIGIGSKYYIETADQLKRTGNIEYSNKLRKMRRNYTLRINIYFWPLIIIGSIMIISSLAIKL